MSRLTRNEANQPPDIAFNPDAPGVYKSHLLDYIYQVDPHAIINPKSRVSELRSVARDYVAKLKSPRQPPATLKPSAATTSAPLPAATQAGSRGRSPSYSHQDTGVSKSSTAAHIRAPSRARLPSTSSTTNIPKKLLPHPPSPAPPRSRTVKSASKKEAPPPHLFSNIENDQAKRSRAQSTSQSSASHKKTRHQSPAAAPKPPRRVAFAPLQSGRYSQMEASKPSSKTNEDTYLGSAPSLFESDDDLTEISTSGCELGDEDALNSPPTLPDRSQNTYREVKHRARCNTVSAGSFSNVHVSKHEEKEEDDSYNQKQHHLCQASNNNGQQRHPVCNSPRRQHPKPLQKGPEISPQRGHYQTQKNPPSLALGHRALKPSLKKPVTIELSSTSESSEDDNCDDLDYDYASYDHVYRPEDVQDVHHAYQPRRRHSFNNNIHRQDHLKVRSHQLSAEDPPGLDDLRHAEEGFSTTGAYKKPPILSSYLQSSEATNKYEQDVPHLKRRRSSSGLGRQRRQYQFSSAGNHVFCAAGYGDERSAVGHQYGEWCFTPAPIPFSHHSEQPDALRAPSYTCPPSQPLQSNMNFQPGGNTQPNVTSVAEISSSTSPKATPFYPNWPPSSNSQSRYSTHPGKMSEKQQNYSCFPSQAPDQFDYPQVKYFQPQSTGGNPYMTAFTQMSNSNANNPLSSKPSPAPPPQISFNSLVQPSQHQVFGTTFPDFGASQTFNSNSIGAAEGLAGYTPSQRLQVPSETLPDCRVSLDASYNSNGNRELYPGAAPPQFQSHPHKVVHATKTRTAASGGPEPFDYSKYWAEEHIPTNHTSPRQTCLPIFQPSNHQNQLVGHSPQPSDRTTNKPISSFGFNLSSKASNVPYNAAGPVQFGQSSFFGLTSHQPLAVQEHIPSDHTSSAPSPNNQSPLAANQPIFNNPLMNATQPYGITSDNPSNVTRAKPQFTQPTPFNMFSDTNINAPLRSNDNRSVSTLKPNTIQTSQCDFSFTITAPPPPPKTNHSSLQNSQSSGNFWRKIPSLPSKPAIVNIPPTQSSADSSKPNPPTLFGPSPGPPPTSNYNLGKNQAPNKPTSNLPESTTQLNPSAKDKSSSSEFTSRNFFRMASKPANDEGSALDHRAKPVPVFFPPKFTMPVVTSAPIQDAILDSAPQILADFLGDSCIDPRLMSTTSSFPHQLSQISARAPPSSTSVQASEASTSKSTTQASSAPNMKTTDDQAKDMNNMTSSHLKLNTNSKSELLQPNSSPSLFLPSTTEKSAGTISPRTNIIQPNPTRFSFSPYSTSRNNNFFSSSTPSSLNPSVPRPTTSVQLSFFSSSSTDQQNTNKGADQDPPATTGQGGQVTSVQHISAPKVTSSLIEPQQNNCQSLFPASVTTCLNPSENTDQATAPIAGTDRTITATPRIDEQSTANHGNDTQNKPLPPPILTSSEVSNVTHNSAHFSSGNETTTSAPTSSITVTAPISAPELTTAPEVPSAIFLLPGFRESRYTRYPPRTDPTSPQFSHNILNLKNHSAPHPVTRVLGFVEKGNQPLNLKISETKESESTLPVHSCPTREFNDSKDTTGDNIV